MKEARQASGSTLGGISEARRGVLSLLLRLAFPDQLLGKI